MNKNIIIAVLVFALGGWYYWHKNYSFKGSFDGGVYTDSTNAFSLSFPAGWTKASAEDITPAKGFNVRLPSAQAPSLVVLAPAPHKAFTALLQTARPAADYKKLAEMTLQQLAASGLGEFKPRDAAAEGALLPRLKAHAVQQEGALIHITYFPAGEHTFLLMSMSEKGFAPELPAEFEKIADTARRI